MSLVPRGYGLNDDEQMMLDAIQSYAQNELLPLDRKWDEDETSVAEILPGLSEMGLMNLAVPEDLGGLGCSYKLYAALLHEIAIWSPSVAVTLSVHNMVGKILAKFLPEPHRSEWVGPWGEPASFGAFALTEADAGSDAASLTTQAVETEGGYTVTGEKMWITNGMAAGWFLTAARLPGTKGRDGIIALLIPGDLPGIERTKIVGKMGIRGSETAVIAFDNVEVPRAYLIGEVGQGLSVFLSTLNEGRVGIAAQSSGIAEACLNETLSYAKQREQFGSPIGRLQAVGDMLAQGGAELEASRALIWSAASKIDAGHADRAASSMAKLYASEAANRIAYNAVQIHGGTGYVRECRIEQLFRDARVTSIYEGASEIQRLIIARQLDRGRDATR